MNKQELLTKLAIECATWGDVVLKVPELSWHVERELLRFTKQDWLDERERLLNKPSWAAALPRETHRSMDHNGNWFFYTTEPFRSRWEWNIRGAEHCGVKKTKAIAIPAGYDWKESLEERPVDYNTGGIDSQTKQIIMKRFLTVN